jgi:hypothetical protein
MIQREFYILFNYFFLLLPSISCRTRDVGKPQNRESLDYFPRNHSGLFNSMIYPFTRTVIYGSIWYQGRST